nr:hypothetical protein Iba_chr14aCG8120 [Ipomoea batatas]
MVIELKFHVLVMAKRVLLVLFVAELKAPIALSGRALAPRAHSGRAQAQVPLALGGRARDPHDHSSRARAPHSHGCWAQALHVHGARAQGSCVHKGRGWTLHTHGGRARAWGLGIILGLEEDDLRREAYLGVFDRGDTIGFCMEIFSVKINCDLDFFLVFFLDFCLISPSTKRGLFEMFEELQFGLHGDLFVSSTLHFLCNMLLPSRKEKTSLSLDLSYMKEKTTTEAGATRGHSTSDLLLLESVAGDLY